jgi:hypothetical protein
MERQTIYTRALDKDDDWDGIVEFSQNRTLYVDQLVSDETISTRDYEPFRADSMEQVFDHYKPGKEVELKTGEGVSLYEQFSFRSLDDFEDEQLIAQSELLVTEVDKIDTYNNIIFHVERNKALRDVFKDETARKQLRDVVASWLAELMQEGPKDMLESRTEEQEMAELKAFLLLKGPVQNVGNMDPKRRAAKRIFLTDSSYVDSRRKLANDLLLWKSFLDNSQLGPIEIIEECKANRTQLELNLQNNLYGIHDETRQLEIAYRTLDAFFNNAPQGDNGFLFIMNVNKEELQSYDSHATVAICTELKKYYDALSLKDSFSLLVMPGYLGDTSKIRMWAETAHKYKVLLVTDFKDCLGFEELKGELWDSPLQGSDMYLAHVIATCNYLLGRKKSELAKEDDDVYIPGSGALAGRLANTKEVVIAQGVVGKDFGLLNDVAGTRISLLKAEISALVDQGVVPIVEEDGRTYALSNRTLYHGSAFSLQEYPIVRVLDWVNKVLMNYIHEIANENWDKYNSPPKLEKKIREFLDHYRGYQLLFSKYKLGLPEQDPVTKIVKVDVSITPFFAAKNFIIKLEADNKRHVDAQTTIE